MTFKNPILPGFYPDPSICRNGDDYYLVNSSFEYFPGVPLFHSRDLVNWEQIGHCLSRESQLPLKKELGLGADYTGGIWAPSIRYHDSAFYMVTTNTCEAKHFIVTAQDPRGEWSEPVWINHEGIDPSLLFDDNGTVYLTFQGRGGIYQSVIDAATGAFIEKPRIVWKGTGAAHTEGPHLYKINGLYYLLVAEGGTSYGHMVSIARSDSPWGPFEHCPRNPVLSNRSTSSAIQATGHGDLVQAADGTWWMVCLGVRRADGYPARHHLGRETFLVPVVWDKDGWPVCGRDGHVDEEMEGPSGCTQKPSDKTFRDDFNGARLSLCWNFIGNPSDGAWSLTAKPGSLTLIGKPAGLDSPMSESPVFVGRRQQHFCCEFSVHLDFAPQKENEQAGICVYMNRLHHYEIAVSLRNGKRCIIVRRKIGSMETMEAAGEIADGSVVLSIAADKQKYSLRYAQDGAEPRVAATGETRYLATETAGGFVGAYFGMYASGGQDGKATPAIFDWAQYRIC